MLELYKPSHYKSESTTIVLILQPQPKEVESAHGEDAHDEAEHGEVEE